MGGRGLRMGSERGVWGVGSSGGGLRGFDAAEFVFVVG